MVLVCFKWLFNIFFIRGTFIFPIYAWVFHIVVHFGSVHRDLVKQCKYFQCGKRMPKQDVTTQFKNENLFEKYFDIIYS